MMIYFYKDLNISSVFSNIEGFAFSKVILPWVKFNGLFNLISLELNGVAEPNDIARFCWSISSK